MRVNMICGSCGGSIPLSEVPPVLLRCPCGGQYQLTGSSSDPLPSFEVSSIYIGPRLHKIVFLPNDCSARDVLDHMIANSSHQPSEDDLATGRQLAGSTNSCQSWGLCFPGLSLILVRRDGPADVLFHEVGHAYEIAAFGRTSESGACLFAQVAVQLAAMVERKGNHADRVLAS
jgi:hypothetical protein